MKTKNFPEKKNQRRIVALGNLLKQQQRNDSKNEKRVDTRMDEIHLLEMSIRDSRRDVRTKKRRGVL